MAAPVSLNGSSNQNQTLTGSSSALGNAQLNMQQFLSLMTEQLENQDPLDPMSDSDFFAQMAQLGQVEGMQQLTASSSVQQAQSLMGQTVIGTASGTNASGNQVSNLVSGTVQSLSIQNGVYYLGVQQANGNVVQVPLNTVQAVENTPSMGSLSDLVGQTVTGSTISGGQTVSISGTVTSVQLANGVPTVTIKESNGTSTTLPTSALSQIS